MGIVKFRLPDLGEGLEEAEVVRWLVAAGDTVTLNQPLVEVDTAKALVEIPSPHAGKVVTLHAAETETVKVGSPLVSFDVEGATDEPAASRTAVLVGYGVDEGAPVARRRRLSAPAKRLSAGETSEEAGGGTAVQAPPPVRKLAAEMGVDLASISGRGPQGRITREDVLAAADPALAARPSGGQSVSDAPVDSGGFAASGARGSVPKGAATPPDPPDERIAVRGIRKLVAEKMTTSVREIPHVTTFLSVDATHLLATRDRIKEATAVKITPLAVVAKAFVQICAKHPKLNSRFDAAASEIVIRRPINLGIATDTERGLVVAVVREADSRNVVELASDIERLAAAAREGTAKPEDLTGSTVTISNVGSFGAEYGTPIINYPEASILALGVIADRPVAIDKKVTIRPLATMSLSFDHRVLDGAEAGRALKELKELLEDPERLAHF